MHQAGFGISSKFKKHALTVPSLLDRYVIDPKQAVDLVDENTIGICTILGVTYTGEYEDTKAINDMLVERNIDCPIHG